MDAETRPEKERPVIIIVDDSPKCKQIGSALAVAMLSAQVIIASGPILPDPEVFKIAMSPIPEKKVQPWKRRAKWGKPWR